MTRERAIQILKMNEQEKWRSGITAEEEKEAVDMAVKALQRRNYSYNSKSVFELMREGKVKRNEY